jgi:hypothetical protein
MQFQIEKPDRSREGAHILRHKFVVGFLAAFALFIGTTITTIAIAKRASVLTYTSDCAVRTPFVRPVFPEQTVFTARVLYVPNYQSKEGRRSGPWGIASVQHRYWGLPWWGSKIVVLTAGVFEQGEIYFVDGSREALRSSRFLPIVYVGVCTRTRPLNDATIDIHILDAGPRKSGGRIIGQSYRRDGLGYKLAPGIKVQIEGSNGSTFAVSDDHAIYDVSGLPPGRYAITIEHPDRRDLYEALGYERRAVLGSGDIAGRDVYSQ